jgi:hypothetical protein
LHRQDKIPTSFIRRCSEIFPRFYCGKKEKCTSIVQWTIKFALLIFGGSIAGGPKEMSTKNNLRFRETMVGCNESNKIFVI